MEELPAGVSSGATFFFNGLKISLKFIRYVLLPDNYRFSDHNFRDYSGGEMPA